MNDITTLNMVEYFLANNTRLDIEDGATLAMLKHLNLLSTTVLKRAEEESLKNKRKSILAGDIDKAFKSIGGGLIGNIEYHTVKSQYLKSKEREIIVYLPPSYNENEDLTYPVLYMNDGQNLFDSYTGFMGQEWHVNDKVEFLIENKIIEEIIIVGVYNGCKDREYEYTWTEMKGENGGGGKYYGYFLTEEVKPFIDKTYRAKKDRDNTAIIGSSLGGLISFYLVKKYPHLFSKIGMMSPSLWWNDREPIKDVEKLSKNFSFDFWVDAGTEESDTMVENVLEITKKLTDIYGEKYVIEFTDQYATHSENAWAERIHGPLIQFFGLQKDIKEKKELINRLMQHEEWIRIIY